MSKQVIRFLLFGATLWGTGGRLEAQRYEFTTLAGLGTEGYAEGKGRKAKFNKPKGIAVDQAGNVFVADCQNHVIRKVLPDGTVSTFAGKPKEQGFVDGLANEARFDNPEALAVDASGNLYVADAGNHVIRKITPEAVVSTLAGMPHKKGYADGQGKSARFHDPGGTAVDGSNNVYVADYWNHVIRKITPDGTVSTVVGKPGEKGCVDGSHDEVRLDSPMRIVVSNSNVLYFVEMDYFGIRMVLSDGSVSTFAGGGANPGFRDGKGKAAEFGILGDIAFDEVGNLYVAENVHSSIRKITPDGTVTTIAGKWISMHDREVIFGRASRDGVGLDARFSYPCGIAVDKEGNIYVADTEDNTIRVGRPIRK